MEIGSLLAINKGLYDHVSAYLGNGTVIQNHPSKGIEIVSLHQFAQGKNIQLLESGVDNVVDFLSRVQSLLADPNRYNIFKNNCEHTVSWLRTGISESPQLSRWGWRILGFSAALYILTRKK